ncbi:hypothetical protein [Litoribacter populi]|uniref:hypothetical protein n=1 Tax=Litoribacter populi TaxID=2598460 RepID=UPI00117E1F36|nr:hypothetical protein [Litoribacter populi]
MGKFYSKLIFILGLLFWNSHRGIACVCDIQKPILEYYASEMVFEGKVEAKTYSQDKQEFTINFNVQKIYKGDPETKSLEFTFPAEGKFTGTWTSCDWSINEGEEWIVYAYYKDNRLNFGGICSNSGKLINYGIKNIKHVEVLENAQDFILTDYIYRFEGGFTIPEPKINIDSLFSASPEADLQSSHTILDLKIDEKGVLQGVYLLRPNNRIQHPLFETIIEYDYSNQREPNEFEKAAIKILENLKQWEPKIFKKTGEAVRHHRHVHVNYDKIKKQWSYEL